jgi:sulfate transport system permease protein
MSPLSKQPWSNRPRESRLLVHLGRATLILVAMTFLTVVLILPLLAVLSGALEQGLPVVIDALADADTLAAVRLTAITVAISVPANVLFGLAAAWAISKFRFPAKSVLVTLIDLPLSVSPVISGMIFILIFGAGGVLGPWLEAHGIKIIFAWPAVVVATMFVTLPYVARELIPLMQAQGREEEEAALSLGASGWRTFFMVTLPNIKWGLLYGTILCAARALGEFGAVSVVSGHIRGETNTVPLHVEILYNEYRFSAAFTVASFLVIVSLIMIAARGAVEWRIKRDISASSMAASH